MSSADRRPSRIIVLNDFAYINGGTAQVALSGALGLARSGIRTTVFTAVPPVMEGLASENLDIVCIGQHEILMDPNRLRAVMQGIWNKRAAQEMRKLLAGCDPGNTIVHVHGWIKALSSSPVRVALDSGFRVVCTVHDYFLACPNGGFFDYPTERICLRAPMSLSCLLRNCDSRSYLQKVWRSCRQAVQQEFGRMPSGIRQFIAISEFSKSVLLPFLPPGAVIHDVANPIDIEKTAPVRVDEQDAFVAASRFSPEKGLRLFAKAASRVGARTLFIGDGPGKDAILSELPGAVLTGWLPRQAVVVRLREARALVLPSVCYETFGLTVLEAAALGIPAIVPDSCAARELVEHMVTGLWFRGGDVDDLQRKMEILMDAKRAAALGKAAYDRYWAHPNTIERHVDELLAVYRRVLS